MVTVFLALGSNLKNKTNNLQRAIKEIEKLPETKVKKISPFYQTKPEGFLAQPDFLNAAIKITTQIAPLELLDKLKTIEKKMGRDKTFHWGPRIIDIDILLYGNLQIELPELRIPHPKMHERIFVLKPLQKIAPLAKHPVLKRKVWFLYQRLIINCFIKRIMLKIRHGT